MPPLFPLTLALYAAACALYFVVLAQPAGGALLRAARLFLVLAVLGHTADIGWLCLRGLSPSVEAREAVFFASYLLPAAYLAATLRGPLPVVAALILPVSMVLQVAARLAPAGAPEPPSGLRSLHILCATLGLALFGLGAGGAAVYLVVDGQLKRRHLGRLGRRGPSLETLDTLNRRAVFSGFPLFTVALVTGAAFLGQRLREGDSLGALLARPEHLLAVVSWLLFALLLLGRATMGLRGRRAALLTLYGFASALAVLGGYFLRGLQRVPGP